MSAASKPRRAREIAAIHMGKKKLELSDEVFRDWLCTLVLKRSVADLTAGERAVVLDAMRRAGHTRPGLDEKFDARNQMLERARNDESDARGTAAQLVVLRGLWAECSERGVVRNADEAALLKFVTRMTGIRRLEWLTPANLRTLIEGLKAMRDRGAPAGVAQ